MEAGEDRVDEATSGAEIGVCGTGDGAVRVVTGVAVTGAGDMPGGGVND